LTPDAQAMLMFGNTQQRTFSNNHESLLTVATTVAMLTHQANTSEDASPNNHHQ